MSSVSTASTTSSNNNTVIPKTEEERKAKMERLATIREELLKIDSEEGSKNQALLAEASALHADPNPNAVNKDGKTAEQIMEEFNTNSAAVGKKKTNLEEEMIKLTKGANAVADNETLRKASKERAEASAKACQEKPSDMSEFSNQELDKIRSQLQGNPLPGGETASVDDGTGGQGKQQQQQQVTSKEIKKP